MSTTPQFPLTTPRLFLHPFTPAIIHDLFNTKTKAEIMDYFACDEASYHHFREMHEKGMETHRLSLYAFRLVNRGTGKAIGECGFHTWNNTHRRADVFYLLRNDADKNQGFMSEALPVVLGFGFSEMNLHRVAAYIDPNNTPSLRLLLRNGFRKEGTMREDYNVNGINESSDCYSLLKWEWENNQN